MDSFIETFHIDWKIIIAQAINFGVVLIIFYSFALKPLKKVMSERSARIEKGLVDAKHNSEILTLTQKEADEIVSKARLEAHDIWKESKDQAEIKRNEIIDEARDEVQAMITSTKKILADEKLQIIDEAKKEIVSLVVSATEKLLEDDEVDHLFVKKQLKHINEA